MADEVYRLNPIAMMLASPTGGYVNCADYDHLARELAECRAENDRLRASLANSGGPCSYCSLPKAEWAKCQRGFPGCPRTDDAMLCPHVGDSLETERELAAWKRAVEEFLKNDRPTRWKFNKELIEHSAAELMKADEHAAPTT